MAAKMGTVNSAPADSAGTPREKPVSRVVVFADSDVLKDAYRDILTQAAVPGLTWSFAESPDEAVQGVDPQAARVTAVVVDVKPSTVDVRKLARQIKQRSPATQIILVSERLTEHEAWKVRHEGIDEVLLKPLEKGDLVKAMSGERATWPSPELKSDEAVLIERMDISARIQHMILIVCFGLLVLSGFPLLFPDSRIFEALFFYSSSPFELRAILHRFAAVGLILVSVYHVYYLVFTQAGRENFRDILPVRRDLKDFADSLKYNLGIRKSPPEYPRYSIFEKVEYLGAFWGTFIMCLTGILLWETNWTLSFLPLWCLDVIRVVHRYEAILALGFVAIWHMYCVYMKMGVSVHGKISLHDMKEEYPGWYKQYVKQQLGIETPQDK